MGSFNNICRNIPTLIQIGLQWRALTCFSARRRDWVWNSRLFNLTWLLWLLWLKVNGEIMANAFFCYTMSAFPIVSWRILVFSSVQDLPHRRNNTAPCNIVFCRLRILYLTGKPRDLALRFLLPGIYPTENSLRSNLVFFHITSTQQILNSIAQ
jgi:hypothetical protein